MRWLACLVIAACEPANPGQIVLHVDTDAILPPGDGRASLPDEPPPLFDRLRVDLYDPNATEPCAGCSRTFSVDADRAKRGMLSFGVVPRTEEPGYRARLRLYAARNDPDDALTSPDGVIDVVVTLPTKPKAGAIERTAFLPTDWVGQEQVAAELAPGSVKASKVGTWSGAARVPCATEPALDEVCVPGGAFWMGRPKAHDGPSASTASVSRLVVMSPFFLQKTEVTVAMFRLAGGSAHPWSNGNDGSAEEDYCSFTPSPSARDDLPLNCVNWREARDYCLMGGGDLPTEAQLEYAAGGGASLRYVWGEENPRCGEVVFGRSGWGVYESYLAQCRTDAPPGGLLPVRSGPRDRLWTATGVVYDLIGSLSEWALDHYQQQDGACWSARGVFHDPLCETNVNVRAVRGGNWVADVSVLGAHVRFGRRDDLADTQIGFRCARVAQ